MNSTRPAGRTLTAAILVRNDSQPLAATLASLSGVADEIVVLDTGSTDDSREVALAAGAEVFTMPWGNDFSAARNELADKACGDWLLWLDAGETLTAADGRALRQFAVEEADRSRAYMMLVITPVGPRGEAAEQIGRIRLLPHGEGIRFAGRVRESVEESLAERGIVTEGLPMRIHRGPREHDPQLKLRRARRDLVLAEEEIKQMGAHPRALLTMAEALRNLGQRTQSAELFRTALHRAPLGGCEMLEAYYGVLTTLADGTPGALEVQVAVCLEALETYPLDGQLLCALGGFLVQQGQTDLGVRAFETAVDHGQLNPLVHHLVDLHATAAICAATALASRGELSKAAAILERSLAAHPHNATIQARLAELRVKPSPGAVVSPVGPWHTGSTLPVSQ